MVTLYDIQELQDRISQYRATLQEIRDLTRTDLIPTEMNIELPEKWNSYRLAKIEFIATKSLKEIKND